jgi:LPXTG-site transpeptidase (sortase) family protein
MESEENNSGEIPLFKEEYMNDPFREPNFVYKSSPSNYFKIHVDHISSKPVVKDKKTHKEAHHPAPVKHKKVANKGGERRTLKNIFKDAGRQITASVVIFIVGFLLLNWQSYSQIVKSEVEKAFGVERSSPLEEIVETVEVVKEPEVLETSVNPEVQKKQIPELNLEIAPTDNRLIVPRIDQNIPIVRVSSDNLLARDWGALENEMQDALQDGVVHYPGTSLPGQIGNVVLTGHSSYFPWDAGRFKDVFALLHDVVKGDKVVVYYEQDKYIYEITDIKIVLPEDIEVLKQTANDKLTLITCTPVGTNLKRLIVSGEPISKNGVAINQDEDSSSEGVTR